SAGDVISQTAGSVIAGTLTVTAGGAAGLGAGAADNDVAPLGAVTSGGFRFRNVDGFSTAGSASSRGDVTLIAETRTLALGSNVSGVLVALTASTGDINQTAGVISADTLTGFAGRHADLGGANRIVNLGGFVAHDFTLVDVDGLTVVGAV